MKITSALREPLLHFLLIGAALFALYGWVNPGAYDDDHVIVVDAGRIAQLRTQFERTWSRPPGPQEMDNLVDGYVNDEIFYRQALALGLDGDDAVIRRRLRQKMEFLTEDAAALDAPGDAQLQAYLDAHPDRFRQEPHYSFEQLYFSPDRPGEPPRQRALAARAALLKGEQVSGDPSLLPAAMGDAGASRVDREFGDGFAHSLDALTPGQWSEPLSSTLGIHLVRLEQRQPGYMPPLSEVRDAVAREWLDEKTRKAKADLLARLRADYRIVIRPGDAEKSQ